MDVVQGAAVVLTKEALRKGFRFDPNLFFGGEEHDLGCWAKSVSMRIYVLEEVEVVHHTHQARMICDRWHPDPLIHYYAARNGIYIKGKYSRSKAEFAAAFLYTSLRNVAKAMIFFLRGDRDVFLDIIRGIRTDSPKMED